MGIEALNQNALLSEISLASNTDAIIVTKWWESVPCFLLKLMELKLGFGVFKLGAFELKEEFHLHYLMEEMELTRFGLGGWKGILRLCHYPLRSLG